jgi:hypothetical protein
VVGQDSGKVKQRQLKTTGMNDKARETANAKGSYHNGQYRLPHQGTGRAVWD